MFDVVRVVEVAGHMTAKLWLSPIGIAEANSPQRVRRQRTQFAAWCGRTLYERYGMLPIYLAPPLALLLALQAIPDLSVWISQGGFAVLAIYMIYRHEKLTKSSLRAQEAADERHATRMREMLATAEAREKTLVAVVEGSAVLHGRLLSSIDALVTAVDKLVETRACPFDGDDHPARKRRAA
jgi:hypothetical protein